MKTFGIGIVGTNWAARGHLPAWRMLPDRCTPVAVCTTRMDTAISAAERLGLPHAYEGFDAMLADPDIDIVSLGAPPPARTDMTLKAIAAGKHVFSCIPFAVTAADAHQMADAARRAHVVGALDAYFMWTPGYAYLKHLINDGFLGELYAVNVDFSMAQAVMPPSNYPYRWTGCAKNGTGVLPNSCSHVFHTLLHLFGPIAEIIGESRISNKLWTFDDGTTQRPEVADTAVLMAKLESGALVNIHAGRAVPTGTGLTISAYGSGGRLTARCPAYPLDRNVRITAAKPARLFEGSEEELEIPPCYFTVPTGREARDDDATASISLGRLFAHMLDAIEHGVRAQPDFQRGAHVHDIVATVERSQVERKWQRVVAEADTMI